MRVLLISTYDLGHAPFGLASPAAWLRDAGALVRCLDLAVEEFDEPRVRAADLIAFHLPMHTATRLAARVLPRVRSLNPAAHRCAFGLYAAMNEDYLRRLGIQTVLSGEFEAGLTSLLLRLERESNDPKSAAQDQPEPRVSLERQRFLVPDRSGLPPLERYARLHLPSGEARLAGYTEASRGCRHRCRHCPIVPVYGGRFRIVEREVVLADIRQQVACGARHITFGDPDFLNGPGHALPIVRALHAEHPDLTYDATIKIEHLIQYEAHLPELAASGCAFVTTAAESVDDAVLARLEKGHTRLDFDHAVRLCRAAELSLQPTFIPFTPWTGFEGYRELLSTVAALGLIEQVSPVQLAIRLLIPAGSRLLELEDIRALVEPFDSELLVHPWRHRDPAVDRLQREVQDRVAASARSGLGRTETFRELWELAFGRGVAYGAFATAAEFRRTPVPYLTEPWYC